MDFGGAKNHHTHLAGRVWAITSYFPFDDPAGLKRRLRVYREFRRRLQVPLVAIELSLDGAFDLTGADAEILLQVSGGAILWQKERLLNLALQALPGECDTVAWIDCDVALTGHDWAAKAREMLKDVQLLQPFHRLYHLTTDTLPETRPEQPGARSFDSVAYRYVRGELPDEIYLTCGGSMRLGYTPGIAWVAPRDLLARCSFYDAAILGSGDKLMFSAACGRGMDAAEPFHLSPSHREHFEGWAGPFFDAVRGRIAHLDGEAYHFWHGELASRNYNNRYNGFNAFDFDPREDIAPNSDGVWSWNSDKPELHQFVRRVFERRREGPSTPPQGLTSTVPSLEGA